MMTGNIETYTCCECGNASLWHHRGLIYKHYTRLMNLFVYARIVSSNLWSLAGEVKVRCTHLIVPLIYSHELVRSEWVCTRSPARGDSWKFWGDKKL